MQVGPQLEAIAPVEEVPATLLVGNPNVGKSMLFGLLTGRYATVSNYPGTTVEVARGTHKGTGHTVIDAPGTNSLVPNSEDEQVTRDLLLRHLEAGGAEVQLVLDVKNLRRGLNLALQVAELEAPAVVVANMLDEARARGVHVDLDALSEVLGATVVGTVATRRQGVGPLTSGKVGYRPMKLRVTYDEAIEDAVAEVVPLLPASLPGRRGIALMLLAGDRTLREWSERVLGDRISEVDRIRADVERRLSETVRLALGRARMAAADQLATRILEQGQADQPTLAERVGDLAMHPLWGLVVAAVVLYAVYLFVGVFGAGTSVDFLETHLFEAYVTPWSDTALRAVLPLSIESFMVGPPGTEVGTGPGLLVGDYGLISMALSYSIAIVFPIVGCFFLAFALMEDSGYLPRLAVMLNRLFKVIGLNGKAVLPMILGLGCATMATMTARILPRKKERVIVTLLLALGVPCSAQLGVILGMLAALSFWATLTWMGAIVLVLLLVGYAANKVLPGQGGDFILEIPPVRRPVLSNIAVKTAARIEWYLREAVPLFILGTLVLWILDRLALLGVIQRVAAPVVQGLLGLPAKATDAFLIGFLRRDYGAAGLYDLFDDTLRSGTASVETEIQVIVAMVTITLFVPCIANFFMIIKERGWKAAVGMSLFILPFAFLAGGVLNYVLRAVML